MSAFSSKYTVGKELGSGAFSVVKEAIPVDPKQKKETYAVKIITRSKLTPQDEAALKEEVDVLKELIQGPHILQLTDVIFTDGNSSNQTDKDKDKNDKVSSSPPPPPDHYYIVTELMAGGELFDRIVQKTCFSEHEARNVCKQLLQALDYCHSKRIAHRDLKPENMLLKTMDENSEVVLADFGFAKKVKTPNSLTTQCGTPEYVAPEILENKPYDVHVDMWSFGVIVFILLGGYPPFMEKDNALLFRRIKKGYYTFDPAYWKGVSVDAKSFIRSMIKVDTKSRIKAADALRNNAWINAPDNNLSAQNLDSNLAELKKFNARRKFRRAVKTVIAARKFMSLGVNFEKTLEKVNDEDGLKEFSKGTFGSNYKVGDELGSGAFSIVKEATQIESGNSFAVKIVTRGKLTPQDENALKEEVEILKHLDHPNIIELHDFFNEKDYYYLVTEKMMGGELFDRIVDKSCYTEHEAREICVLLFDAIRYCHQCRVAHRDLKPENLLLKSTKSDSDVKIADFGFAKKIKVPNSLRTACGTPDYVAPEILEGKPYDVHVDMWSLGVIVFILMGGYFPFEDNDQQRLFRKIKKGYYSFHKDYWGGVSDDAQNLIRSLLTVDRRKRLTAVGALAHSWINSSKDDLATHDLGNNLEVLKKFNARRKFKQAVKTVIAARKLISLGKDFKKIVQQDDARTFSEGDFAVNYSVGKELGSGAFAIVKEAKNKKSGGSFAVKIVDRSKLTRQDDDALKDEVEVMKELQHNNVVSLSDYFKEQKYYYLVLEKMEGGELFDRIVKKSCYNEFEAREICFLLFDAMQYCHKRRIAHRDLKPENLLLNSLDNDSDVKIADFGFAKKLKSPNSLTTQCGTPDYVAPEILEGKPYDVHVDMWSLGVIIFILLGGYFPFADADEQKMFSLIRRGAFEFNDEYWRNTSADAKNLIKSLLTVDRKKRLTAVGALADKWINAPSYSLANQDLGVNLAQLKKFNAKRKFKSAVKTVVAARKITSLGINFRKKLEDDTSRDISSGKFSEKYKIGVELGSGAFSVVHEATEEKSGKSFAAKVITCAKLTEEDEAALKDEIEVLRELKHNNIIKLVDLFREDDHDYLVMEKMEGGELFDRIVKKTSYSENEAREVCFVLFDAIQYCHYRRIAHRDLKPENLLMQSMDSDSNVKIADFGFAKKVKTPNSLTTQCGTPDYVAPEILEGKPYDVHVDMWSFGVIVYILLGGYPPFVEDNDQKLYRRIKKGQYRFDPAYWGGMSAGAKDMIRSLLTVNRRKRLTAVGALAHPWINSTEEELANHSLGVNLAEFKKFNAKRKFKSAIKTVIAARKFTSLGVDLKKQLEGDDETSAFSPGSFISNYSMGKELGSGAFSTVKEATRTKTGETFAVKIITRAQLSESDESALKEEIDVLKVLNHENIIKLMDFFNENSFYYLVLEKMEGGELFDRIVEKTVYTEYEASETCLVIFDAIQFCHHRRIAHRDLKPENLLLKSLDSDSDVKLADFGFAKKVKQPNSLKTQCGTPDYVAPEILEGTPYDVECDMWSLGVIVFILMGGYFPFSADDKDELFRKIRKAEYQFEEDYWSSVSQGAKDLISGLLTVNPKKRLTAVGALSNTWMNSSQEVLVNQDLGTNLAALKKFNAKRKFKSAVKTIMAARKITSLGIEFKKKNESTK